MNSKKILITSYYFYPENTPRAFRAFELAKGFAKKGHEVTVIIPKNNFNYFQIEKENNFKVIKIKIGYILNKKTRNVLFKEEKNVNPKKKEINNFIKTIKSLIKPIYNFIYFDGNSTEYGISLFNYLKNHKKKYDINISIGLPFSVIFGTGIANYFNKQLSGISIAEYGDPYSENSNKKRLSIHKYIEKKVINNYDYISVPIEKAVEWYLKLKNKEKIKVIPQGFDFDEIKIYEYKKNKIPTFGYAGSFYNKIRNPSAFLDYLITLTYDFKFIIYTDLNDIETIKMLKYYKKLLKEKLVINSLIPRLKVIEKLSKMDFLINISNVSHNQIPSKLIDYALTKRPILSFNQNNFDKTIFNSFINNDYSKAIKIKIEDYDINNIIKKFEQLFKK